MHPSHTVICINCNERASFLNKEGPAITKRQARSRALANKWQEVPHQGWKCYFCVLRATLDAVLPYIPAELKAMLVEPVIEEPAQKKRRKAHVMGEAKKNNKEQP